MSTLIFYAQFTTSKTGTNSLTVTWDVERITRSDGARSALVTGGANSVTIGRRGLYGYVLTSADLTLYDYIATAITATSTVDQQEIPAMWSLWSLEFDEQPTSGMGTAGTIGKLIVDNLNSAVGSVDSDVWSYTTRTLTQSAVAITAAVAGSTLTIQRGDTVTAAFTGLGAITNYLKLWITIKERTSDPDTAAIALVLLSNPGVGTDGLQYLNGAAGTAAQGALVVDSAAAGDVTLTLEAAATTQLVPHASLVYDIQWKSATSKIYTLTSGTCVVTGDVSRAVS